MAAGMEYIIYLQPIVKEINCILVERKSSKPIVYRHAKKGKAKKDWQR